MSSILYQYTPDELQQLLNTSHGYLDVLRKCGLYAKGRNCDTLKKIIKEYNLDETQLNENRKLLYKQQGGRVEACSLQEIFDGKHPYYHSNRLAQRLVTEGYFEYKCAICGISDWMGRKLTLQLDHINGVHQDNSLANLRLLCPNCHSQTDTYCGKKSKELHEEESLDKPNHKKKRQLKPPPVTRECLKQEIRTLPFVQVAKIHGVTDNAVRKWCKKYNLPIHPKEIKQYTDEEWMQI